MSSQHRDPARRQARVEELFRRAHAHADPAARSALLAAECAGDPALRIEIESLLAADVGAEEFLTRPAAIEYGAVESGAASPAEPPDLPAPRLPSRYRVERVLGAGGMGSVYLAEQLEPVRRPVAIKVLSPALAGPDTRRRFEFESQVLAMLDHTHIARIYETGLTDDGLPFFVMEFVAGTPVTEYCERRALAPARRLELFVAVCAAVQHAHQKGVIHRDLKPTNLLVKDEDGRALPKVIDFGVAKALAALPHDPLVTLGRDVIGTPAYMSPEQAEGRRDIDTRSDVYTLGVVLYELLVGAHPFDIATLARAPLSEELRVIREQPAPRPTARLRALAGERHSERTRWLRGDLEWVILKAIEKDPARRYPSVSEFAADVQRVLDRRPVGAAPPSTFYRLRKWAARNRAAAAAGLGIAASLAAGVVVATVLFLEAREQARIAREESARARTAQHEIVRQFDRYYQATEFLLGVTNDQLADLAGATLARRSLAEQSVRQFQQLSEHPDPAPMVLFQAGYAHQRLGEVLTVMGETAKAHDQHLAALAIRERAVAAAPVEFIARRTLGVGHWKVSETLHLSGRLRESESHNAQALEVFAELYSADAADLRRDASVYLGIAHRRLADGALAQGDRERARAEYTIAAEVFGRGLAEAPDYFQLVGGKAQTFRGLAEIEVLDGRPAEALALIDKCVQSLDLHARQSQPLNIWERSQRTLALLVRARAQRSAGALTEAMETATRACAIAERLAAEDPAHFQVRHLSATSLTASAETHLAAWQRRDALEGARRAAAMFDELMAHDSDNVWVQVDAAKNCLLLARGLRDLGAGALPPLASAVSTTPTADESTSWRARARELLESLEARGVLPGAQRAQLDESGSAALAR